MLFIFLSFIMTFQIKEISKAGHVGGFIGGIIMAFILSLHNLHIRPSNTI
ncbi:rhomboid family intramembrane serine protease [Cytobacillus sp. IB215316]